jgi:catechol 2,3-dioxygenase-like lactoylglutathione lyase family enzyme
MVAQIEALVSAFESGSLSRRDFVRGVIVAAAAPAAKPDVRALSLNHVTLAVDDVDASQAFYERVLGVSEVSRQFNGVNLGLGGSFLGLYDVEPRGRIHHFCVGVEDYDLEGHAEELRRLDVEPFIRQDRPELYFTDPDGITVQLSEVEYRG